MRNQIIKIGDQSRTSSQKYNPKKWKDLGQLVGYQNHRLNRFLIVSIGNPKNSVKSNLLVKEKYTCSKLMSREYTLKNYVNISN